jgi:hypothetical protein
MNLVETNELLMRIQAVDGRPVGDATVAAWHELLQDLDFDAAREGVRLHFQESEYPLKPAHIIQNVERIRSAGIEREDEWGNRIEPDAAAVAALERIRRGRVDQRAVTS